MKFEKIIKNLKFLTYFFLINNHDLILETFSRVYNKVLLLSVICMKFN